MAERLAITDRFERFCFETITTRLQPDDFFEQAPGKHLLHAPIDFRVEGLARRIKAQDCGTESSEGGSPPLSLEFGQGSLLEQADLHRPDDFVGVLGGDAGGGSGIEPGEAAMQTPGLARLDPGQPGTQRQVAGRALKKAIEQRADFGEQWPRAAGKFAGGEDFLGLQEVEQMVRNTAALRDRQLGRADVEAPVELQRVTIYDFSRKIQG